MRNRGSFLLQLGIADDGRLNQVNQSQDPMDLYLLLKEYSLIRENDVRPLLMKIQNNPDLAEVCALLATFQASVQGNEFTE